MATIISAGTTYVSKGMILDSPEIIKSGYVLVQNSGTVSNAIIRAGGRETVTSGGLDLSAFVVSGGGLMVQSGGLASRYAVTSSGYIAAYGGRLSGGSVESGGQVIAQGVVVSSAVTKGYVSSLWIVHGGEAVFNSNGVGSNILVDSGSIFVSNGGYVETTSLGGTATVTSKGARMNVLSGGSTHVTYVRSNGFLNVSSGGTATVNRVSAGGSVLVAPSGYLSGTTGYGGVIYLSGGSATDTTVLKESGVNGGLWLSSGAMAASTTIDSGGTMVIGSGASTLGSNTLKDGLVSVGSGAEAYNFTMSGGIFRVFTDGVASSINVSGGYFYLLATPSESTGFASAKWVTVQGTGSAYVNNSALLSSATVQGGGMLSVMSGGSANDVKVSSGGLMHNYEGTALNVDVMTSGELNVHEKGWVSACNVYGKVNVSSGGSVNVLFVQLLGTLNVGGLANECTIYSGGRVNVSSGGKLLGAYAQTGGIFTVQAGGTATISSGSGISAWVGGGNMFVSSAQVRRVVVYDGGAFAAREGSYISGGNISAGTLALSSGCSAGNVSAFGDGSGSALAQLTVMTGAKTSNGRIWGKDGRLKVNSGGSAFNMVVESAGTATVSGIIESANVSSGGFLSITTSDGLASRTSLGSGGSMELGTSTAAVVTSICSGGYLTIMYSATANLVHVIGGGLILRSGGSAISTYVRDDGFAVVNSNAKITTAYLDNGGRIDVFSSATVYSAFVSSGGLLKNSGGSLGDVRVLDGGTVICDGGYAWGNVSAGGDFIFSAGWTDNLFVSKGGRVRMAGYADLTYKGYLAISSGGILDFDISKQAPATEMPLLEGFDHVDEVGGGAIYTLTVNDSQSIGSYQLASNALAFNKTITVKNIEGTDLGTLTLGGKTTIGEYDYSLAVDADQVLTVSVEAAVHAEKAKSDIDGNGISDVMFVWTGTPEEPGNYQHGYWMNGTNEWQSANSNHPAEWDNLGCYDMTGDGKADSVLFGNVTSEAGVHGAYIGYYADANDLDANWVNIGYLTNEDNIDWKNKVGNLTGNASGANSIVWYTYELGALGAWTDGTENWVSIKGGFNADWTLVGCGDFSGDGKDQVVMSYNGGAKYYAYAIDGTYTELGDSDSGWTVRAIGDFSGDGKDDIVAFHQEYGIVAKWADGLASNWSQLGQLDAKDWFVVGAGDYDGDAKDDLLVRQISTGMLGYYGSGDMAQWNVLGYGVDMNWTVIA